MAFDDEHPTLLFYLFEPKLYSDGHYSERHWNFIKESIIDLNKQLKKYETKIHIYELNPVNYLKKIIKKHRVNKIFSHIETGIDFTYKRDIEIKKFCKKNGIEWVEEVRNGVFGGEKIG